METIMYNRRSPFLADVYILSLVGLGAIYNEVKETHK